jgi:proline dehydrogenase
MLDRATKLAVSRDDPLEFQMLMEVRGGRQPDLGTEHELSQCDPSGRQWLASSWRRVLERRENVLFALQAINTDYYSDFAGQGVAGHS